MSFDGFGQIHVPLGPQKAESPSIQASPKPRSTSIEHRIASTKGAGKRTENQIAPAKHTSEHTRDSSRPKSFFLSKKMKKFTYQPEQVSKHRPPAPAVRLFITRPVTEQTSKPQSMQKAKPVGSWLAVQKPRLENMRATTFESRIISAEHGVSLVPSVRSASADYSFQSKRLKVFKPSHRF